MSTSKIKRINGTSNYVNSYGTTIYHQLEMENGDKIEIGKKKLLQAGWEIDYEIVEFGQQEWQKAKSIKKEFNSLSQAYKDYVYEEVDRQKSWNDNVKTISHKEYIQKVCSGRLPK